MKGLKDKIPLFHVLRELKPYQRQLILDHLDSKSCRSIISCVKCVLKAGKSKKSKDVQLQKCIKQHHQVFAKLLSSSKKGKKSSARMLARVGGNPLGLILGAAIPLIMNLFKK